MKLFIEDGNENLYWVVYPCGAMICGSIEQDDQWPTNSDEDNLRKMDDVVEIKPTELEENVEKVTFIEGSRIFNERPNISIDIRPITIKPFLSPTNKAEVSIWVNGGNAYSWEVQCDDIDKLRKELEEQSDKMSERVARALSNVVRECAG